MKPVHGLLVIILLLTACGPTQTTPPAGTIQALPAENMERLEACGFAIDYPVQLSPDGQSSRVMFLSDKDPDVSVFVLLRRSKAVESSVRLDILALYIQTEYFPEKGSLDFEPVNIKDSSGKTITALQEDVLKDGVYTRLMIFVRPETLLSDQRPDDVIYELVGQAPESKWDTWKPLFDEMFQSIQPRDCQGE